MHREKDFCFGAKRQSKIIISVNLCALCASVVKSFSFVKILTEISIFD